jgi:hypothetical protein
LNLSPHDRQAVLNTIAEAGPITEEVSHDGSIQAIFDAIQYTSSSLDKGHWYCDYMIVVDRPGWESTEQGSVLVVKSNFKGEVDGESLQSRINN